MNSVRASCEEGRCTDDHGRPVRPVRNLVCGLQEPDHPIASNVARGFGPTHRAT